MDWARFVARQSVKSARTRQIRPLHCCLRQCRIQDVSPSSSTQKVDDTTQRADSKLARGKKQQSVRIGEQFPPFYSAEASRYTVRSHTCGELRLTHEKASVRLFGWVEFTRLDCFILLRDAYGTTQVIVPDSRLDLKDIAKTLSLESVVCVEGTVERRPEGQKNERLSTGEVEVVATNITVLGAAQNLPFLVRNFNEPTEQLRMKHRYLYLRYPKVQGNLRLRSQVMHRMRDFLVRANFVEVETPTLFRKTPGGAQEFVVPTQIPGHFYSLVQSPQQFKQLLMVGGLDRYFQIARCYRDEKVKSDRQPEFTQLDLEVSFVDREGMLALVEELLVASWPSHLPALQVPFQRMTHHDAIETYGSDKPDTRFECRLRDVSNLAEPALASAPAQQLMGTPGFAMCSLIFPGGAKHLTRAQREDLKKTAQTQWTGAWLLDAVITDSTSWQTPLLKTLSPAAVQRLADELSPRPGDVLLLGLGPRDRALGLLGTLRVQVADLLEAAGAQVRDNSRHHFLWVLDFPLFEPGEDGSLQSAHHPFTQPHPEDVPLLDTDPLKVRGLHYDLVLNGAEVGGGSIRISDTDLQQRVLRDLLHVDISTLQHLIDALSMGAPPHGGIALGLDRLMAIICGAPSIRDVIAFPKGLFGKDIMSGAPALLTPEDAKLYHLPLKP